MPKVAAIDVGSNAMRLLIADVSANGTIKTLFNRREPVRLGEDVFAKGIISPETREKAVEALEMFRAFCDKYSVILIRAVGTSALREAQNSQVLVDDIKARTGINLEIISGSEEARLIHSAVSRKVNLKKKLGVLIDIGGGSTEVSLVLNGDIIVSETHKIGAVRLLYLLEVQKYPFKVFSRLVSDYVKGLRRQLKREIGDRKIDLCVGTGGNFESLGVLREKILKKRGKNILFLDELEKIMSKLNQISVADRIKNFGLKPDRADVIGPAASIITEIMREAKVNKVTIPCVGLKDGIIADLIPHIKGGENALKKRQLLSFAHEMLRKYDADIKHAETVSERASYIFSRTAKLHKLSAKELVLLEVAALLHDIGHFISSNNHHKHSMYLINSTPIVGLDKKSQEIIACIARYHRKSAPRDEHEIYKTLSKNDKRTVLILSAILRIADATDRGQGRVKKISLRFTGKILNVKLKGSGDLLLEKWAINKKSDIFERHFGIKVSPSS